MTATDPNSDYNTSSTDLFQNLPEPFQSDTNRAVMSNLFNRFLTKTETTHAVGYIGQGNPNAVVPRQLREPTVARQAYQLQPILYEKIGSVEHITAWYDILNSLAAQGVDINDQSSWGSATIFNWAPPVDINKIVNYRDYYWYDSANPQSQPQYVTVKSECASATALVNFYSSLIAQYGATFTITDVIPAQSAIVVSTDLTALFATGFIFYIENSYNTDLNNSFQKVVSSSYSSTTNETTIIIGNTFTDTTADGNISLNQQYQLYEGIATCKCTGEEGWDQGQWDDNQTNNPPPIWNVPVIADIAQPTLSAWNAVHTVPEAYDIWWDTTDDILYTLEDPSAPTSISSWKLIYNNFSLIEQQTTGSGYWDLATGCGEDIEIVGLNQWISQNKWIHKTDVPNFAIAKQAQLPIIEFEPNLELSEWISTAYVWQYRATKTDTFAPTTAQPNRFEIEPLDTYTNTTNVITLDEKFGDLTDIFVPGYKFSVAGYFEDFVVSSSEFIRSSLPYGAFQTIITITGSLPSSLTPATNYLQPITTSQGDPFTAYGDQWLFMGAGTTTAINHQPEQSMMTPTVVGPVYSGYKTILAPYAEQFDILAKGITALPFDSYTGAGSTRSLSERALVGANDVRVYVNNIRQYGTYDELGTTYVTGIQFLSPLAINDTVLVQVGEATYKDFGNYAVPVRTIVDNTEFAQAGTTLVSLVQYRRSEQVKTSTNQYPLFDIYDTDSNTTYTATPIFGFYDSPTGVLYTSAGQRIVQADDGSIMFKNYLVERKNGPLYAYRNYNLSQHAYWYNPTTSTVYIWTGETWSTKYETSEGRWVAPYVQSGLPSSPFIGMLVFDTITNTLHYWDGSAWVNKTVYISTSDETLQTNWRHGLNNEQFVPKQVDWFQRSYAEYESQYNTFIDQTTTQLLQSNPTWTTSQAQQEANTEWTTIQQRWINPAWYTDTTTPSPVTNGPLWIGNWQIPDTLYFNPEHEDWQYISATQLQTHFLSIVNSQPKFPGFSGQASANWRLIDYTQVNWGLGGTIHEYDNSFDTFLSSQFINTITPPSLFGFAQGQYEDSLVMLRDLLTRNFVTYLTNTTTSVILNPTSYASSQVLTLYEENEAENMIYGDSTTYIPATSTTPASGVKNWIATLPFFGILPKVQPYIFTDTNLNLSGVMHHDGHRQVYKIPSIIVAGIQAEIANTPDPRVPGEKYGRISSLQPPSTQALFIKQFSTYMRNGVYWLHGSTLYRIAVANVGTTPPAGTYPDGTLWWDTTVDAPTLRQQTTIGGTIHWYPATGLTIGDGRLYNGATVETSTVSAWQIVDLNTIYLQTILDIEQRLYDVVPPAPITPPIDFAALEQADQTKWDQYLQQQFTNYTIEYQIASPYTNTQYNANDAFTWNYKYSTVSLPPRSGTIPSGGTWQDVYEKAYGTPYPHLEPWLMQGYSDLPSWWNSVYANDDTATYGNRRWKYIHGLPVLASNQSSNEIQFSGDVSVLFNSFDKFSLYYLDGISKSVFTVTAVSVANGNTTVTVAEAVTDVTPGCSITIGMWDYIIRGDIPTGYTAPLQVLDVPQYAYTSVNISSQTFVDEHYIFNPDDLLPPYWDYTTYFAQPVPAINTTVRSIFDNINDMQLENADYKWMDAGPIEWQWRQTTNYLYALLSVSYLVQPVRTIQKIFGIPVNNIDRLPIDSLTGQVFSHGNTQFHGEITVNNEIAKINGINQWYVNFNRSLGYDTSYSNFRTMWTGWTAPLTYQFSAFLDTDTLSVQHRTVSLTSTDYDITMKRSPGTANYWIDAFNVQITSVPQDLALYNTQSQWVMDVRSQAPVARTISYYDVQLYDYYIDPATSICYLYTYPVIGASPVLNSFAVAGDVSHVFGGLSGASKLQIAGNNAGTYTVVTATYDPIEAVTEIIVKEPVLSDKPAALLSAVNYKTLPWSTGTIVMPSSTELVPLPLQEGTQYFFIKLSPTTFQFAYTSDDVISNTPIQFTSQAFGIQRVGALKNSFLALGGANATPTWYHYTIDTSSIRQLQLPTSIAGIQSFINILDGYHEYTKTQGFGINVSGQYSDPATGQQVSWQNEIERFIDWAYQQRTGRRAQINDKYAVQLDYTTSKFTFTSQNPGYVTGQQVVVWSFGGGLPTPLKIGQTYFIIANSDGTVNLASDYANALKDIPFTISLTGAVGNLYLSTAQVYATSLPSYEINPFRNALWFSPEYGVVSNLVTGPFKDVYSSPLLFDQYGRSLTPSDLRVFRQDKITQIQFASGVYNDAQALQTIQRNPYAYLHLGGGNIYIDTYEHIMQFNDYTSAGALVYDPFIGLNITKIELDFYKQATFTERPNVGGYFLSQPYNQGASLLRNIEGTLEDLRYVYDPYKISETLPMVKYGRSLIGYPGIQNYLSQINLTSKSQFLFWTGTIHNKGSLNTISAFINSRRFVNAEIDEFWAYKVADYGPVTTPVYPEMWLTIDDTISNDLRLEFILTDQVCLPGYQEETFGNTTCGYANPPNSSITVNGVDSTFTAVAMTDLSRWYNQPDVLQDVVSDGGLIYFDLEPKQKLVIYPVTLASTGPNPAVLNSSYGISTATYNEQVSAFETLLGISLSSEVGIICYDPTNSYLTTGGLTISKQQNYFTFWMWNGTTFVFSGGWNGTTELPVLRHNFKADTITATMNIWPASTQTTYVVPASPSVSQLSLTVPYLPLTNSTTVFKDGQQLTIGVDYVESLELFSTSQILGYKLYFAEPISGSTINVVYGPSQLNLDTQFQIVNTNIISLLSQEFIRGTTGNNSLDVGMFNTNTPITIWGLEVDKEALNPAEVIDTQAHVDLTPVTYWDPARGYDYYEALNSIDLSQDTDPANYDETTGGLAGWKEQKVGTVWFDTTNAKYLPYYDTTVIPAAEDRFNDWGQLADFGEINVYEWTASPYPPDQYNAIASVQEGDSSINPSVRLSGTVKQDVQYRNRTSTVVTVTPATAAYTIITIGSGTIFTSDPTGLSATTTYTFTVTIDANTRTLSYTGAQVATFGDLLTLLSQQLAIYGATISLTGNTLVITSNSVGSTSIATISDTGAGTGLFSSIVNYVSNQAFSPGQNEQLVATSTAGFAVGDTVLFYSTGTLPSGLTESVPYTISAISGNAITLSGVTITDTGSGTITMGSTLWPSTWTVATQQQIDLDPTIDGSPNSTQTVWTFDETVTTLSGQTVDVYVNGVSVQPGYSITGPLVFPTANVFPSLNAYDRVTLIVPVPTLTAAQLSFDPSVSDNGSVNTQYRYTTQYVTSTTFNESTNATSTTYYFWVKNKTTSVGTRLTTSETTNDLITPPAPYMFFGKLISPALTVNSETEEVIEMPWRFSQVIIRGLRGYVDDENRYVIRFIRDFSLRDTREFTKTGLQLKVPHQEWLMFRKNQLSNVPQDLWNKVTEAMAGYLLSNTSTRVPALNRELYDSAYGTSTRYGLGIGQAFCDGPTAINTITTYLNDPSNDFYPIDMDIFFEMYNFDTPANVVTTMDYIYNNFGYAHVNAIFFSVLLDALNVQREYAGLMKTSAIALYGIELLDVAGAFDD